MTTIDPDCWIVQLLEAGVWSVLPAWSVARTEKVWEPELKPEYVWGEEHGSKLPESSWHSNVALGSSEEKVNVASVEVVVPEGPESIVVSGAAVSTVQVRVSGVWSVLPAASVARTENVCSPSLSPV